MKLKHFFIFLIKVFFLAGYLRADFWDIRKEMEKDRDDFYQEAFEDRRKFLQDWFRTRNEIIQDMKRIEREMRKKWTEKEINRFWNSFGEFKGEFVKVKKQSNLRSEIDYNRGVVRATVVLPGNVDDEKATKIGVEAAVETLSDANLKPIKKSKVGDKRSVKAILKTQNFKKEVKDVSAEVKVVSVEIPTSSVTTIEIIGKPAPAPPPLKNFNATAYTGVIFDARNLNILPCVSIKVMDEEERMVYGPEIPESEYIRDTGICGWVREVNTARPVIRIGDNPLIVKVKKIKEDGSFIISNIDAQKVIAVEKEREVLKKGRVVVAVR